MISGNLTSTYEKHENMNIVINTSKSNATKYNQKLIWENVKRIK